MDNFNYKRYLKESKLFKESIDTEEIDRFESLSDIKSLENLKNSLDILIPDWIEEGWEILDIANYIRHLINMSYSKIKQ